MERDAVSDLAFCRIQADLTERIRELSKPLVMADQFVLDTATRQIERGFELIYKTIQEGKKRDARRPEERHRGS